MTNACEKWKDQLLEAALTGAASAELTEHLRRCAHCAQERKALEERRTQLDALLPQIAQGSEPSGDFRARVIAAADAAGKHKGISRLQAWALAAAGSAAALALVLMMWNRGSHQKISPDEIAIAQRLAEWRAPSDSLLATPGQEILKSTPKLGESYLTVPVTKVEEE